MNFRLSYLVAGLLLSAAVATTPVHANEPAAPANLPAATPSEGATEAVKNADKADIAAPMPRTVLKPGETGANCPAGTTAKPDGTCGDDHFARRAQRKALMDKILNPPPLPGGTYQKDCVGCSVFVTPQGKTYLGCACLQDELYLSTRLLLDECKKDEEVSFCNGLLQCGVCKTIPVKPIPPKPGNTPVDDLVNQLFPSTR